MSLDREERKTTVLLAVDAVRQGIESVFFTIKMEERFQEQSEDFKSGFELALGLIHNSILDVMRDVEAMP